MDLSTVTGLSSVTGIIGYVLGLATKERIGRGRVVWEHRFKEREELEVSVNELYTGFDRVFACDGKLVKAEWIEFKTSAQELRQRVGRVRRDRKLYGLLDSFCAEALYILEDIVGDSREGRGFERGKCRGFERGGREKHIEELGNHYKKAERALRRSVIRRAITG